MINDPVVIYPPGMGGWFIISLYNYCVNDIPLPVPDQNNDWEQLKGNGTPLHIDDIFRYKHKKKLPTMYKSSVLKDFIHSIQDKKVLLVYTDSLDTLAYSNILMHIKRAKPDTSNVINNFQAGRRPPIKFINQYKSLGKLLKQKNIDCTMINYDKFILGEDMPSFVSAQQTSYVKQLIQKYNNSNQLLINAYNISN